MNYCKFFVHKALHWTLYHGWIRDELDLYICVLLLVVLHLIARLSIGSCVTPLGLLVIGSCQNFAELYMYSCVMITRQAVRSNGILLYLLYLRYLCLLWWWNIVITLFKCFTLLISWMSVRVCICNRGLNIDDASCITFFVYLCMM